MAGDQNRRLIRDSVIAAVLVLVGMALSVSPGGTWWLLGLAALVWAQTTLVRTLPRRSPLMQELYRALAWLLLAFAALSLLPEALRPLADVLALLAVAATVLGPKIRRAR
jgi:glucan phosphoethanolaminetransferase (alkaline phosphatase superfamily)